jgi:hypothetical protein
MRNRVLAAVLVIMGVAVANPATASTISWTQWTGSSAATDTASGTLLVGATSVGVTATGSTAFDFVQTFNGGGTNYWIPNTPYLSATVSNAPPDPGIVALGLAGTETITFTQPIDDPLISLVSWNGASVTFPGEPITYLSSGCGFWGCGSFGSQTSTSFTGVGELHGVIELVGDYSSITFTDTVPEFWHGFSVGVVGLADSTPPAVPEPATLTLTGLGLIGAGIRRYRRRQ